MRHRARIWRSIGWEARWRHRRRGGHCAKLLPGQVQFGCYGDGGAVFTNDDELKDLLLSLRMHGQGSDRYEHVRCIGLNPLRLDTIQAV